MTHYVLLLEFIPLLKVISLIYQTKANHGEFYIKIITIRAHMGKTS